MSQLIMAMADKREDPLDALNFLEDMSKLVYNYRVLDISLGLSMREGRKESAMDLIKANSKDFSWD